MESLVLIPPMGHSPTFYQEIIPQLKSKFNVIALDYPRKKIDKDDPLEYLVQFFALKIKQNVEGPFYLMGLSLGATLCYRLKEILGA